MFAKTAIMLIKGVAISATQLKTCSLMKEGQVVQLVKYPTALTAITTLIVLSVMKKIIFTLTMEIVLTVITASMNL